VCVSVCEFVGEMVKSMTQKYGFVRKKGGVREVNTQESGCQEGQMQAITVGGAAYQEQRASTDTEA